MTTSFKPLQTLATTPAFAVSVAQKDPAFIELVRGSLSPDAIATLILYCGELISLVRFHKENDSVNAISTPSFDLSLRYALGVAKKILREDVKKAQGEWALRKLKLQAQ